MLARWRRENMAASTSVKIECVSVSESNDRPIRAPSLALALVLSLALVLIDGLWLGQGAIAMLVAALVVFAIPLSFRARYVTVRRQRLRKIAIYLGAVVLVLGFNAANNRIAQQRADTLIATINSYHAKNGSYPRSLQDLVPEYLPAVPRAKYALTSAQFRYIRTQDDALLLYTSMPPFGRPTYSFRDKSWSYID